MVRDLIDGGGVGPGHMPRTREAVEFEQTRVFRSAVDVLLPVPQDPIFLLLAIHLYQHRFLSIVCNGSL